MNYLIVIIFILGYLLIVFEHAIGLNKASTALLTGVLCWVMYIFSADSNIVVLDHLNEHIAEIAGILFFLLGAMTIVELIDAHDGFESITSFITTTNKKKLIWIVSLFAFFLSAVLDNLTTTIVMVSLLRKLISDKNDRMTFIGIIIIATNAGGAWSPIGDITTTMLWIGGQVTAGSIITKLILPSIVSLLIPLIIISFRLKGNSQATELNIQNGKPLTKKRDRNIIFYSGLSVLLLVPVFKSITHLPPYMGVLLGLGILWMISEIIHKEKDDEDKTVYSVVYALRKIDVPSILFFLGILLSVSALASAGILSNLSAKMNEHIKSIDAIVLSTGILSSVVDNVPLVAGAIGMYDLSIYPTDHYFWEFLAYSAGTGGSILIIGSAAGVAAMGMEKINFFWYLKNISWLAFIGYLAGATIYILSNN